MYLQNPTAKARPISPARALIYCSDVLRALSLQSQSQGCNSTIYEERFQLFFLSCNVPGAQLGFQLNICKWATHKYLLSRMFQSSRAFPSGDGICGISVAASKRELARELSVAKERQVPVCGERSCSGSPSVCITQHLPLGKKVMINLDSILKSRDITLLTKVHLVKAMVFPVVVYEFKNCIIAWERERWRRNRTGRSLSPS